MSVVAYDFYPESGNNFNFAYNASEDRSAGRYPNITGIIPQQTLLSVNVSTYNSHLKQSATNLIGSGLNLNHLFLWDTEGQIRGNAWDIGADQHGSGIDSTRPDSIPMCVYANRHSTTDISLWMRGAWPSSVLPLWIGTYDVITTITTLESGGGNPSNYFPLYIYGAIPETGIAYNIFPLVLGGGIEGLNTSNLPLFINALDLPQTAGLPLWIGTYYEAMDLLTIYPPNTTPTETGTQNILPFYIQGAFTAGATGYYDSVNLTLFGGISGITTSNLPLVFPGVVGFTPFPSSILSPSTGNPYTLSLYIQGISPINPPDTTGNQPYLPGAIPLFIRSENASAQGRLPLYISSSGNATSVNLYMLGGGYNPDPYFVGTPGALPHRSNIILFINRGEDSHAAQLPLYLHTITGNPSGTFPLTIASANSGINTNINLFINASLSTGNVPLYTHGF